MKIRIVLGFILLTLGLLSPGIAGGKADLQKYFNDAALKVKATVDPEQKRAILHESFRTMTKALDVVERMTPISGEERVGLGRYKATLLEKQDELLGQNGYERVTDGQLNAFSDYVVQDMEQADPYISISLVAALLIVILLILVF